MAAVTSEASFGMGDPVKKQIGEVETSDEGKSSAGTSNLEYQVAQKLGTEGNCECRTKSMLVLIA
jgi:hypothetical protein